MFGNSIYEFLFVLALIFIAVDFFILSDLLSIIAYFLLSYLVVHAVDLPWMYGVLLGIGVWFVVVFLHYAVLKKITSKFCNQVVAPSVIDDDPLARYIGVETTVIHVNGKKMIRLEGDLISFKDNEQFNDGDVVEVTAFNEGVLEVKKKSLN